MDTNMKIQFVHNRDVVFKFSSANRIENPSLLLAKGGETIAMEEVPLDMFQQITKEHILSCFIGKALCSKKDNYNKKIGRNIATARMKEVDLEVVAIENYLDQNDRPVREVTLVELGTTHTYLLQHKEGNDKVHFIQYER